MPERLDAQGLREVLLTPGSPWSEVSVHDELDSTNAEAARMAQPWLVVVADHQTAGRGRLGRRWESTPGASVAASVLLPRPVEALGWLPLLAGLAMSRAIADVAALTTVLKWPNDVLAEADDCRKVSGVLCELTPAGVVVGAGANVSQRREELPAESATSLALCGATGVRREDLLAAHLAHLADGYAVLTRPRAARVGTQAAYRSACSTIGREVDLHLGDGSVRRGVATGVDEEGRLIVLADGEERVVAAADVVHVRGDRARGIR